MGGIVSAIQEGLGKAQLAEWDLMKPAEIEKFIKDYKEKEAKKSEVEASCPYMNDSEGYASGNKELGSYKICCEMVDYCSFYKQSWFMWTCIGVAFLIIIVLIIVSCVCCCCRRRGGGGKDLEVAEESSDSTYSIQDDSTQKE